MKQMARRDDLDLGLTGEFGNGPSGIARRYIEMPNLSVSSNLQHGDCRAHHHAYSYAPQRPPRSLLCTLADARPFLILGQLTGDNTQSLWQLPSIFKYSDFLALDLHLQA